ncbi:hypothetical protein [Pantoea rwandensis]|uniref:Uncharacterized protein n=1 Tax=Pantoea rwandensis TaxID=1076550 RepID=A0ABM5RJ69_9GAMM|nr:hypothetical protein [Pantoea rwandensis]AIR86015.1 hypothetical protein LH22_11285 [Pantoea rwandensis]
MRNQVRVKYNRLKSNLSIDEMFLLIKSHPYSQSQGHGYSNTSLKNDKILSTYTEEKININFSVDPYGNENSQELLTYESFEFSISKITNKLYLLCIINPPKSLRPLTDKLSSISKYKIGFGLVDIQIDEYIKVLHSNYHLNLINIKKVKISSLVINDNAKASIEITSKKNAISDIESIINNRGYSLDKVKASGFLLEEKCEFELSRSGSLCTAENLIPFFDTTISEHLLKKEI